MVAGAAPHNLVLISARREAGLYPQPLGRVTNRPDGRPHPDQQQRVENLIRPIALNRKNALFAGHDEGGIAWGRIASLIETCEINSIEPFAYLKATLAGIANGYTQSQIDDPLPWNFARSS